MHEVVLLCALIMCWQAYDQAFPELENLRDPEFKDSALIMQLLRDNLSVSEPAPGSKDWQKFIWYKGVNGGQN